MAKPGTKKALIEEVIEESQRLQDESGKPGGFSEYAWVAEEILIKVLPYISKEGLIMVRDEFISCQNLRDKDSP